MVVTTKFGGKYRPVFLVRPPGLEPGTLGLKGRCSTKLSYGRNVRKYSTKALYSQHVV